MTKHFASAMRDRCDDLPAMWSRRITVMGLLVLAKGLTMNAMRCSNRERGSWGWLCGILSLIGVIPLRTAVSDYVRSTVGKDVLF